jgi:hypothetical protein
VVPAGEAAVRYAGVLVSSRFSVFSLQSNFLALVWDTFFFSKFNLDFLPRV